MRLLKTGARLQSQQRSLFKPLNYNLVSGCISVWDNEAVVSGDIGLSASGSFPTINIYIHIYIYLLNTRVSSPQPNIFSGSVQATLSKSTRQQCLEALMKVSETDTFRCYF